MLLVLRLGSFGGEERKVEVVVVVRGLRATMTKGALTLTYVDRRAEADDCCLLVKVEV